MIDFKMLIRIFEVQECDLSTTTSSVSG